MYYSYQRNLARTDGEPLFVLLGDKEVTGCPVSSTSVILVCKASVAKAASQ